MRFKKVALVGVTGALVSATFAIAPPAEAAARDGVCASGEFCLYYNSNQAGSVSDFNTSIADYGASQPSCYEFKGSGAGKGLCVKNEVASVWNRTSGPATVYFNSGYKGASQVISAGAEVNLNATLKNENASHKLGSGSAPTSPPPAPSGSLPTPQGGYGSYEQTYALGDRFASWTYDELSDELVRNFDAYFPFDGCGATLTVGETCRLSAPGPDGPVKVVAIAENGIALKSLDGHPEGAGRTITHRFVKFCDARTDYMFCDETYLVVNAWGPVGGASYLGVLNAETVARYYWTKFSDTIKDQYPQCPRFKMWHDGRCRIYI